MKKHVVLVNAGRVVNAKGGTEKVFCDMANALVSLGYYVTAIYFDKNQGVPGFPVSDEVKLINAIQMGRDKPAFLNFRALSFSREVRHGKRFEIDCKWKGGLINKIIKKLQPVDIYIAFQPLSTHYLMCSKRLCAPVVTMLHMSPFFYKQERGFEYYRHSVDRGGLLTVLMPSFIDSARELFHYVPIRAMPNAIPNFSTSANLGKKKIVCIARLSRQKRVDLLIQSYCIIKDKRPDWSLEFYGETSVEPEYQLEIFRLCDNFNLNRNLIFRGVTNRVDEVLNDASIFAFPSLFEGFGLALGEAMSKGLPSVGCLDCSAVNDLITNEKNGLLVNPTPREFADALLRLMDDYDLRVKLGTQARKDISKYSPEKIWSTWHDLIEEVTNDQQ